MINGVDIVIQESSTHSISSGSDNEITAHNIGLESCRLQAGNVFSCAHENLTSKVTALFNTWFLVLQMNSACTCIDEHLNKLHNRGDTAKASIGICDARHQVINFLSLFALLRGHM